MLLFVFRQDKNVFLVKYFTMEKKLILDGFFERDFFWILETYSIRYWIIKKYELNKWALMLIWLTFKEKMCLNKHDLIFTLSNKYDLNARFNLNFFQDFLFRWFKVFETVKLNTESFVSKQIFNSNKCYLNLD